MFLFLLGNMTTQAQDWIYVGKDSDDGKYYIKANYESKVMRDGVNCYKIWIKDYQKEEEITDDNGNDVIVRNASVMSLKLVDCENRRTKLLKSLVYDENNKLVESVDLEESKTRWREMVPETIGEKVLTVICDRFGF